MADRPSIVTAGASMLAARRLRPPKPRGGGAVDHGAFVPVLNRLAEGGIATLADSAAALGGYRSALAEVDPDSLGPAEALGYWLNLYNAGALLAASDALAAGVTSVLRLPDAFGRRDVVVAGEALSLDDIEHGKIRRFGDPRIHAALVCGSVSCPTLRHEPFVGENLDRQLDDQMRVFLAAGGALVDRSSNVVHLSSVFRWYGRDFTRPDLMPTLSPELPGHVRDMVAHWMAPADRDHVWRSRPDVRFMPYDWGLACSVAPAR